MLRAKNKLTPTKFRDAEEILQGSSEDDDFEAPITNTYNEHVDVEMDLLFGSSQAQDVKKGHPTPVQIFRLWQSYLDNVNPLTKLFHAPSIQLQLLEATSDLNNIPKGMEALMFGIYAMAVASLTDEECRKSFSSGRRELLSGYHSSCQRSLIHAGYLRSSDLIVLQAFTLFLVGQVPTVLS